MTPKLTRPEEVAQAARDAEELVRLRELLCAGYDWCEECDDVASAIMDVAHQALGEE